MSINISAPASPNATQLMVYWIITLMYWIISLMYWKHPNFNLNPDLQYWIQYIKLFIQHTNFSIQYTVNSFRLPNPISFCLTLWLYVNSLNLSNPLGKHLIYLTLFFLSFYFLTTILNFLDWIYQSLLWSFINLALPLHTLSCLTVMYRTLPNLASPHFSNI